AVYVGLIAALAAACQAPAAVPVAMDEAGPAAITLAEELGMAAPGARTLWTSRYYEGYVAETLRGDVLLARQAYEDVVAEAGSAAPRIAARAALRLAELEALAGRRRKALELMARASILGRDSLDIV